MYPQNRQLYSLLASTPDHHFLPILNSDDSREDNRGRVIEGDEEEAGGDDKVVEMKGKVEMVVENEVGED